MQTHHPTALGSIQEHSESAVLNPSPSAATDVRDRRIARLLFGALLVFHVCALFVGWKSGLLQGNEFRQTQTALTTLFVQREHNFSLAYPTPVLGKPWSVPMEFPLYQWTVALVSSATGLPLIQAARAVSGICFYLSLPAIWLLLQRLRLNESQRWVSLGFVFTCPLYIFYSRAFLIETMVLMFSLWFLQSFFAAVEQQSRFWAVVANVAGVGAGLVKVTTFFVYLTPAALLSAAWLWQTAGGRSGSYQFGTRFWRQLTWIVACVMIPFLATVWWIKLADTIKAVNPSGVQLVSSSMSPYHFGTWQTRLSSDIWLSHWRILTSNIAPICTLLTLVAVTIFFGGRWRKWIGATLSLFLAVPFTFPVLYSWHEYYWVANTVLFLAALGLALSAMMESTAPRWATWSIVLGLHAVQIWGYFHYLFPTQRLPYEGGSGLTRLIRDISDSQDVLLIAGNDWSSVIPFYSERRALMIRTHLERDGAYLDRAFAALADESVPLLILVGDMRDNEEFLSRVSRQFDIDPHPFLKHKEETVYVSRAWRKEYVKRLFNLAYNDVVFVDRGEQVTSDTPQRVSAMRSTRFFKCMTPAPEKYQVPFGLTFGFRPDGSLVFDAHAPSRLWFHPSFPVRTLSLEFGISEAAYTRAGDRTDGIEFRVLAHLPDGDEQVLFSRLLDPVNRAADRNTQRAEVPVALEAGTEIVVETGPGPSGSNAFDWSYWRNIELH